jgi:hypothetical protein
MFGAAVLDAPERVYVYGYEHRRARSAVLARAPRDKLGDAASWEFLGRSGRWQPTDEGGLAALCDGIGTEFSVSRLPSGRLAMVTTRNGISPLIQARYADDPAGPWSAPADLYRCPETSWDPSYFCYAAKAHPELARGEELIITYACNSMDFGRARQDRRIYRPRFIRVPAAAK